MKKSGPKSSPPQFFLLSKRARAYVFLLINVICWGSLLTVSKPVLEFVSPAELLFLRFFVVSLVTIPLTIHLIRHSRLSFQKITEVMCLELLGSGVSLGFLYAGLQRTTALEANVLGNLTPLFITLIAVFALHEHQERHEWLGLGIALFATMCFSMLPILMGQSFSVSSSSFTGNLLILAANITAGLYFAVAKKVYHGVPKFLVAILGSYVGMAYFFFQISFEAGGVFAGAAQLAKVFLVPSYLPAGIFMALAGTLIGLTAYIKGQDLIEASEASLFSYLMPIVYIPLGYLLLKEMISFPQIGLMLVMAIGVYIAEKRMRKA